MREPQEAHGRVPGPPEARLPVSEFSRSLYRVGTGKPGDLSDSGAREPQPLPTNRKGSDQEVHLSPSRT